MKIRILFYLIGLFLMGFGVTLTIKADLGAGAWDALNVGLSNVVGLTVGSWVIIIGVILIFINALIVRGKPKLLAVVTILLIGFSVDFWLIVVMNNVHLSTLLLQVISLIAGIILIAIGVAMYLQTKFPANPIDQLMISLHERFQLNFMIAKTIGEVTALILAFILQGPIGVGTIIITFLIGPMIQWINKPMTKRYELLLKR
ncbi:MULTISPECIES: YczE/YyaS/YitT family protein [Metabacillus]|uniref:YitT family protein n=1 Tax=Metabacillus endolithicus TaxID=1535204 RepID=A0ABW5C2I0_9BACI|nr:MULTISPECIES: membrane protein [Metabacillus]UGB31436.1 membrane protein [Metabacillus sp. B2-18]UPG62092.1 membrane protein [Metabacillus endolithicus]